MKTQRFVPMRFYIAAAGIGAAFANINVAVPLLFESLLISIAAVGVILILPPIVLGARLPRERAVRLHSSLAQNLLHSAGMAGMGKRRGHASWLQMEVKGGAPHEG